VLATAGIWLTKGIAGAVAAFMALRNPPAQAVQPGFIHLPAGFITLLAAFIPFAFLTVGGRLSCTASERRSFALFVAIKQRGVCALANTPRPISHF
jgi:hypothetical protein